VRQRLDVFRTNACAYHQLLPIFVSFAEAVVETVVETVVGAIGKTKYLAISFAQ
jgi:hypothetical protein